MTDGDLEKVTVGIVSYRSPEPLRDCLRELADHPGPVVVVDNDSGDETVDMVRSEFPWAVLDASDENVGFGAGCNRILAAADTPYLLLLNADARATPGAVAALFAKMEERPDVAIVGPRILEEDGVLQRSCRQFPTIGSFFIDQSGLRPVFDALPIGDRYRRFGHDADREVPWVLGAVLGVRVDAMRAVGGFDEHFFLYFEEIDLSRRLLAEGGVTLFTADAEFSHIGNASSSTRPVFSTQVFYRSGARYFALHGGRLAPRLYRPVAVAALASSWLAALVRRRRNDFAFIKAIIDDRRTWRFDATNQ